MENNVKTASPQPLFAPFAERGIVVKQLFLFNYFPSNLNKTLATQVLIAS